MAVKTRKNIKRLNACMTRFERKRS
ncbi:PTS transporter subunit EIIB [Butyricimonas synergistica]|nr:PTS transporter subunit EIIB [Butyricimonas synergistica]